MLTGRQMLAGLSLALATTVVLTGCGQSTAQGSGKPPSNGVLASQIRVDPAVTGQSGAVQHLAQPALRDSLAVARSEALALAGGQILPAPPSPDPAITAAAALAASGAPECATKVGYDQAWAAKLPAALTIYPRGTVQEAAGTDSGACRLRVVDFHSPASPAEIIDFYYTRAVKAGFSGAHRNEGDDEVLSGSKGAAAYAIYARKLADGQSEVDVIVNGG